MFPMESKIRSLFNSEVDLEDALHLLSSFVAQNHSNFLSLRESYFRIHQHSFLSGDGGVKLRDNSLKYSGVRTKIQDRMRERQKRKEKIAFHQLQRSFFAVADLPLSMLFADPKLCGIVVHEHVQRILLQEDGALNLFMEHLNSTMKEGDKNLLSQAVVAVLHAFGLKCLSVEYVVLFDPRCESGVPFKPMASVRELMMRDFTFSSTPSVSVADSSLAEEVNEVVDIDDDTIEGEDGDVSSSSLQQQKQQVDLLSTTLISIRQSPMASDSDDVSSLDSDLSDPESGLNPSPLAHPILRPPSPLTSPTAPVALLSHVLSLNVSQRSAAEAPLSQDSLPAQQEAYTSDLDLHLDGELVDPRETLAAAITASLAGNASSTCGNGDNLPVINSSTAPLPAASCTEGLTVAKIDFIMETPEHGVVICELKVSPGGWEQWNNPSAVLQLITNGYLFLLNTGLVVKHLLLVEGYRNPSGVTTDELLFTSVVFNEEEMRPHVVDLLGRTDLPKFSEYCSGITPLSFDDQRCRTLARSQIETLVKKEVKRSYRTPSVREFLSQAAPPPPPPSAPEPHHSIFSSQQRALSADTTESSQNLFSATPDMNLRRRPMQQRWTASPRHTPLQMRITSDMEGGVRLTHTPPVPLSGRKRDKENQLPVSSDVLQEEMEGLNDLDTQMRGLLLSPNSTGGISPVSTHAPPHRPSQSLTPRVMTRRATAMLVSSPSPATPLRKRWTPTETQALVDGVAQYGEGNWQQIVNNYPEVFSVNGRTGPNLKDRWRTLQKQKATTSARLLDT